MGLHSKKTCWLWKLIAVLSQLRRLAVKVTLCEMLLAQHGGPCAGNVCVAGAEMLWGHILCLPCPDGS